MRFEFATATRVVFGAGTLRETGALAKEFGRRALLVSGRNLRYSESLHTLLRSHAVDAVPYSIPGEPDLAIVQNSVIHARREKCDLVIAIGGGSAIDAGKAIAALMANEGELLDY